MAQVTVVSQPFGGRPNRLGDHIVDLLSRSSERFDSLQMAVAFAKASGLATLFDHLRSFTGSGGRVVAAIGVDQQGTSRQGMDLLLQAGVEVFAFHNPGGGTYHPKYYLFQRDAIEGVALVGSQNLTRGGLYENFELGVRIDHDLTNPQDSALFGSLLDAFKCVTDLNTGMAIKVDQGTVAELATSGYLADESRSPAGEEGGRLVVRPGPSPLFRRVGMPRGPRPARQGLAPAPAPRRGQVVAVFVMTLGPRDARQRVGYSRDIFVPIAARDTDPSFWDWPGAYATPPTPVSGSFLERRVGLLVTPANGPTRLEQSVRIYAYAERDEFRINCGALVQGAEAGDILVLSKVHPGSGYAYDGSVVPLSHPMYAAFDSWCTNLVPRSAKRWGYAG